MKILNIFTSIIGLVLLINTSILSAQRLNSEEIGNISIEIPDELKSNLSNKDSSQLQNSYRYGESIKGYVNVIMDNQGKIVKILAPKVVSKTIFSDVQNRGAVPCPHCLPYVDNPECVLACVFETIFGKDDK